MTSQAPLVYWMKPLSARWTVDIIFRSESNGASATRGWLAESLNFGRPIFMA